MNRIWRSSNRWRSRSSGAMTTNFARSKAMCRSSSGRVPLPIEPKPIITSGPSKRASRSVALFIDVTPGSSFLFNSSGRARHELAVAAADRRDEGVEIGPRHRFAGRPDEAARAVERARLELERQEPVPLEAARHRQLAGLLGREAGAA